MVIRDFTVFDLYNVREKGYMKIYDKKIYGLYNVREKIEQLK